MKTLNDVKLNQTVSISSINCTGKLHRRLLDLGIIPGTKITPIFSSIFNDPTAYFVRGSVIAIRSEDSKKIVVDWFTIFILCFTLKTSIYLVLVLY